MLNERGFKPGSEKSKDNDNYKMNGEIRENEKSDDQYFNTVS